MTNWETIAQTEDFIIDYDKSRVMYRVSYFQDNHFVDDVIFDAYESAAHAKWENEKWTDTYQHICSLCHSTVRVHPQSVEYKYCPYCGAKMDKEN